MLYAPYHVPKWRGINDQKGKIQFYLENKTFQIVWQITVVNTILVPSPITTVAVIRHGGDGLLCRDDRSSKSLPSKGLLGPPTKFTSANEKPARNTLFPSKKAVVSKIISYLASL